MNFSSNSFFLTFYVSVGVQDRPFHTCHIMYWISVLNSFTFIYILDFFWFIVEVMYVRSIRLIYYNISVKYINLRPFFLSLN